jgi:hypothetical protein
MYQQHLSELELEPLFDADNQPVDAQWGLNSSEFAELIALLPDDPPGPLRTF